MDMFIALMQLEFDADAIFVLSVFLLFLIFLCCVGVVVFCKVVLTDALYGVEMYSKRMKRNISILAIIVVHLV